jgi:hypothetical protein
MIQSSEGLLLTGTVAKNREIDAGNQQIRRHPDLSNGDIGQARIAYLTHEEQTQLPVYLFCYTTLTTGCHNSR